MPTDKGLIVLGIRECCYSVQAAEFKPGLSLATCGFEDGRTLECLPSVVDKVELRQIFPIYFGQTSPCSYSSTVSAMRYILHTGNFSYTITYTQEAVLTPVRAQ